MIALDVLFLERQAALKGLRAEIKRLRKMAWKGLALENYDDAIYFWSLADEAEKEADSFEVVYGLSGE